MVIAFFPRNKHLLISWLQSPSAVILEPTPKIKSDTVYNDKPRQPIKKQRHHFVDKGPYIVKAMVFLVVLYRCESWTIKKPECQRIDTLESLCWRRLLIVPWTARRSNQSILKEIHPGYSLEGLMLKLKLQSFGHLMGRGDSREKVTDAGKDGRQQEKGTTEDEMVGWHH